MRKIADELSDIVSGNALLELGLRSSILNLSQTANFIRPMVEARLKREVQTSAITMALSRLARTMGKKRPGGSGGSKSISIDTLTITAGLSVITVTSSSSQRSKFLSFISKLHSRGVFCTLTQGAQQITMIVPATELPQLCQLVSDSSDIVAKNEQVAALAISFQNNYAATPGFFFLIFQKLYLQNINIVEINSTHNELLIYLKEDDVELAFRTLYNYFARKKRSA